MMRFWASLRFRLILLVLLAILPAMGLMLYAAAEQRQQATLEARNSALRLAYLASVDQERLIGGTRELLITLAHLPGVRGDPGDCSALMADLLRHYDLYSNLGVTRPDGAVFCSALPVDGPLNLADRDYIQRALQSGDMAIGSYQIGRITQKPSINFGYPVLNESGQVQAVVFAALDLNWLGEFVARARLPEGASLTVLDRNATVLARFPDSEQWSGRSLANAPAVQDILSGQSEGTAQITSLDGSVRLHAFVPLGGGQDPGWFVGVGIPIQAAYAQANAMLLRSLGGLALVGALALLAAWFVGDWFVLRHTKALLAATGRLAAGDLGTRSGLGYGGELGQLAQAFDQMAATLEQREAGRRQAESQREAALAALHESEGTLASVYRIVPIGICLTDEAGHYVQVNDAYCRIYGYTREELIGQHFTVITPPGEVAAAEAAYVRLLKGDMGIPAERKRRRRDGKVITIQAENALLVRDNGQRFVITTVNDFTERKQVEEALELTQFSVDRASESMFWLHRDGRFFYVNDAACRSLGYTRQELLSLRVFDIDPDFREDMAPAHWAELQQRGSLTFESRHQARDGRVFPVEITSNFLRFGDQEYDFAFARDITERKRTEEEISRRAAQLEALRQVGLELAAELDLDSVLRFIATRAVELGGGTSGGLYLYRPEKDALEWTMAVGAHQAPIGTLLRRGEGLCGKVWESGCPLLVDDYQHWEGRASVYEGYPWAAVVGVPIQWGGELLGVLNVNADSPRVFTNADVELLSLFTTQAAIAIHNARLFQSEWEQRDLAETLQEIGGLLVTTLDMDTVLDRLLEQVSRVVPNDVSNVMLTEGTRARIVRWRGYDRFGIGAGGMPPAQPLESIPNLQKMVASGRPVIMADTRTEPGWIRRSSDWRSYVGAPIRVRGQVIGCLNVSSATPNFYSATHADRLAAFADQVAIALENARLFSSLSQEKERLELLYRLGRQLSQSLDMHQVAQRALDGIRAVIGPVHGIVLVVEPGAAGETGRLRLASISDYGPDEVESLDRRIWLRVGEGLVGWVAAHRQPVLVDDVTQDARWLALPGVDEAVRSAVSLPLVSGDELVGVLSIYADEQGFFNPDHHRLIESAAATVAIAIANARLYEAEREQHRRVQESQAKLIQAEKMAALGRLVASVAHEINNPLQAVQGSLELFSEELDGGLRRERLERYVGILRKETDRIGAIVRRVRDFYRPARQEMSPTDVNAALDSVLDLAGKQLQHSNVAIERRWGSDLPVVLANADHLRQVFLNLVLNAIDAMAGCGGTLSISTHLDSLSGIGGRTPAVRIEFCDTGQGMPPEALARMFEPFFTTKPNGTGLGLSISYEIIQAHNGQITVASELGKGTTFTILLPAGPSPL